MKFSSAVKIEDFDYLLQILDPKFIERDGRVFFKWHFNIDSYRKYWKPKLTVNAAKVERTINHVHLKDVTKEIDLQERLGKKVKEIWRRVLRHNFPDRRVYLKLSSKRNSLTSKQEWTLDLWTKIK